MNAVQSRRVADRFFSLSFVSDVLYQKLLSFHHLSCQQLLIWLVTVNVRHITMKYCCVRRVTAATPPYYPCPVRVLYTPINHNARTTCPQLSGSFSCCQNSSDQSGCGQRTSEGVLDCLVLGGEWWIPWVLWVRVPVDGATTVGGVLLPYIGWCDWSVKNVIHVNVCRSSMQNFVLQQDEQWII